MISNLNFRKVEGQMRKEEKKMTEQDKLRKQKEDAQWHDPDPNMAKKLQKAQQEEEKKQQLLKNKLEKQLLLEEEEKQLQAAKVKKSAATGKKAKQYDAAEAQKKALLKSMQKQMGDLSVADGGENQNEAENDMQIIENNKGSANNGSNNLQEEIKESVLVKQVSSKSGKQEADDNEVIDKHPEKRMKAAFQKFEDERVSELKREYPTLKMSQIKEKVWKEVIFQIVFNVYFQWKKSPLNPMNQQQ
eukprot:403349673